ncbi:Unknown protein [Striga hermonthica]|uniref:Retrovirus-related Pol polyprotein from transposon TNT 1-94-like beta-barrel domain-containing protein n=1 Tax=Striga hermonthica TaxID=68872 RepID=A0A9N7MLE7_STRHE|nr:Unknown protein [Striga hermonthica]
METNTSRMVTLNGSNYHVWKGKMEDLLYVKDYYLPVFTDKKPSDKTNKEWELCHRQGSSSQKNVLFVERQGRSKIKGLNDRNRSKSKSGRYANLECHHWGKKGPSRGIAESSSGRIRMAKAKKRRLEMVKMVYTPGDFGSVRMGNDGIVKSIGMGDVHLETENGNTLVLRGVKHVPNIRMNLISTGKLDDEGFCNTFRDRKWKLTKGSLIVARGQKFSL